MVRYRALSWLILAATLAYLCRSALGVAESTIREQLGITLDQSGWFMGAFFWTYAILQVPSGWFAERLGTRLSMTIFAVCWSLATLGIGVASSFWLLIVAQLVMGAAQAGILPASCNSIGHWMPVSQRTSSCGVVSAGMQVGAIAASSLTALLMTYFGWRWAFLLFAVPGLVWAVGFYLRFRDRPEEVPAVDAGELAEIRAGRPPEEIRAEETASESSELLAIACNPVVWWLCGQQICRAAGYMFFVSWLPTFMQVTCDMTPERSGVLQTIILAAMLPGNVLGGMLTDWIWRRTNDLRLSRSGVSAVSLGLCSLFILGSWFARGSELTVGLLAVGGFFAALAGPCAFAATIDIAGPRVPQVVAVMNMSGNFAAAACPVIAGKIFQGSEDWNRILILFAGLYFAGALCWLRVNPGRPIYAASLQDAQPAV